MRYLETYKKLGLKEDEVFEYFINTLSDSIFTWDYFVNFKKVKTNTGKYEKELNLLNFLIGKEDIENKFIDLITEYPVVRKVLPILIAVRNNKLKKLKLISDFEKLNSESKSHLFDPKIDLTPNFKKEILVFFNESGLKNIFEDKNVKNLVDYCFGVEVGMDTHARKNRTGKSMEEIIEKIIENFSKENNLEYICQASAKTIREKWGFEIPENRTNRKFDFVIYDKIKNRLLIIETNYYSGTGSKIKSTAGEYQTIFNLLNTNNIKYIWITDGKGLLTTKEGLYETFIYNDYVFNLEFIKKGVLKEVLESTV